MKKATIMVQAKDADATVSQLRSLGIMHIQHEKQPVGEELTNLKEDLGLLDSAINILSRPEFISQKTSSQEARKDWKFVSQHILDLSKRLSQLQEYAFSLKAKIIEWQRWGDFKPEAIQELRSKNIYVGLYQIPIKEVKSLPSDLIVKEIFTALGFKHCVIISENKINISFQEIALPKMSLREMRARLNEDTRTIELIKDDICKNLIHLEELKNTKTQMLKKIEFCETIKGMGAAENIVYLTGFVPVDTTALLEKTAQQERWGVVIDEPSDEDIVPTLIRNPRWVSLVSPIFKFLDILPGYREFDISLLFLIFFSIFFGILIGDAGYGLVYFLLTFFIQRKSKKKDSAFFLFYLLSLCAVIWGLSTGTFFGQEWFLKAGYKPLLPVFNNEEALQRLFFFIGALHLSLAHLWRGIRKAPSINALGDLGWICVLWTVFFVAKTLILGDTFPSFCKGLFISGTALVIIFTNPQKNIFKFGEEWAAWLITLPFGFIGNFADVVSYIRLFAVGLAGVAIADAFNAMAAMIGRGNILMIIVAGFIAFIGNALGVVLGPVSVLVHGIRLNLLEFAVNHMGLSWSGISYKPLKE